MKRTPVVLIHGAWFHVSSWQGWAERFASYGYDVCVPGWPAEAPTAADARRDPGRTPDLGLDALTTHYEQAVRSLALPPVVIGHGVGGLIAQRLLGAGLGRAAVALAPFPVRGVPLVNTRTRLQAVVATESHGPADDRELIQLTRTGFRQAVATMVGEGEAAALFDAHAVPAPRRLLSDLGYGADPASGLPSGSEVETGNTERGPLLLVSGQEDRIVPDAVTRAVYKAYGDSTAVTDLKQYADRGHSLAVDSGWRTVADHVLAWLAGNGVTPDSYRSPGGNCRLSVRRSSTSRM